MVFVLLLPAIVSVLCFCAHLVFNGFMGFVPLVLLLLPLLFVKHGLVARFFQLLLLFIALQWIVVAFFTASKRIEAGTPWLRSAIIFAAVAGFAVFSAALFEAQRLQQRYPRQLSY